ncbi:hypothetical protein GCM10009760_22180 [Kitasatospora kazusensis]|uniref:Uncharacterized protein n=1 Tax=Kitasatospora kazusensis TaxID=407974 RepID=A0ABN2ZBJ2_9ACTN
MSPSPPGSEPGRFWRALWRGLIVLGAFNGLADEELTAIVLDARLRGPGPGHPEKLVPWIPPTPLERDLWSRLN